MPLFRFRKPHSPSAPSVPCSRETLGILADSIPRTPLQLFLCFLVFANSQIFSASVSNPIGIKFFQELIYLVLLAFTSVYLLTKMRRSVRFHKIDLLVLGLVTFSVLYSALAAWLRFGQPIQYGIIEERRILAVLIYFPIVWSLRTRATSLDQILTWVAFAGLFCAAVSIGIFTGVIPPLHEIQSSPGVLRDDRFAVGLANMSFATLIIIQRMEGVKRRAGWLMTLFLIGVLVIVGQTRQILISLFAAIMVLRNSFRWFAYLLILIVVILLIVRSTDFGANLLGTYQELFAQMFTEEYLTQSARALSIWVVIQEFLHGAWLGSGSLSLLWRGGFSKVYGDYFFLADIGIFGTVYKFGVIALPYTLVYLYSQFSILRKIRGHSHYRLLLAAWCQLLILMPVAATVDHRGFVAGLILALSVYCQKETFEDASVSHV